MATYKHTIDTKDSISDLFVWNGVDTWNKIYQFNGNNVVIQAITGSPLVVSKEDLEKEIEQVCLWFSHVRDLLPVPFPAREASQDKTQKTATTVVAEFKLGDNVVVDATYNHETGDTTFQTRPNHTLNPSTFRTYQDFLNRFWGEITGF